MKSERKGQFEGVVCSKCQLVLETSSAAELHRLEFHTPIGVRNYYGTLFFADSVKRGETDEDWLELLSL